MTIKRSLRLSAAIALTAGLSLPAGVLASGGHGHGAHLWYGHGGVYHRHHRGHQPHRPGRPVIRQHSVSGVLAAMSGASTPATLTLDSAGGISITVSVATTTTVVRHYNGPSSLDELSVGDHVAVWGTFAAGSANVFDATRLKDWSIQRLDSRVKGQVSALTNGGATLTVLHGHGRHDPYRHGEAVQLSFTSSTIVMEGSVTATVAAVQPGQRVLAMGVYDRTGRVLSVDRLRILGQPGQPQPTPTPSAGTATPTTAPGAATATPTVVATSTPTVAVTDTPTVAPTSAPTATPTV